MNKAEIIKAVAQSTGHTQKAVGEALEATITVIKDCASKGEEVRLSGLFNMAVTHRPARTVNVFALVPVGKAVRGAEWREA